MIGRDVEPQYIILAVIFGAPAFDILVQHDGPMVRTGNGVEGIFAGPDKVPFGPDVLAEFECCHRIGSGTPLPAVRDQSAKYPASLHTGARIINGDGGEGEVLF